MPIYDYVCTACGTRTEVLHGVNESGPTVCTSCGGALRKALSLPAIVFKGSGWAKKDARASRPAAGEASDGPKKEAAPAGDGGSTDASDSSAPAASGTKDGSHD